MKCSSSEEPEEAAGFFPSEEEASATPEKEEEFLSSPEMKGELQKMYPCIGIRSSNRINYINHCVMSSHKNPQPPLK